MGIQSKAAAQTRLDKAYEARDAILEGKSFTFATENGTRTVTSQDGPWLDKYITRLERIVTAPGGQTHNILLANFNH